MQKVSLIISNANPQLSKLVTSEGMLKKIKDELEQLSLFTLHREAYRLIKFAQGILYISVSSSALATQLRYTTPEILRQLQEKLPEVNLFAIQCKVSAFTAPTKKAPLYRKSKTKNISDKTRAGLSKLSEKIDSQELSEALKRLGRPSGLRYKDKK